MSSKSAKPWMVAEAKARFSYVLDQAEKEGPQFITRNGKEAAVIVSIAEWERKTRRKGNLAEFFRDSPLRGSRLKVPRRKDRLRDPEL